MLRTNKDKTRDIELGTEKGRSIWAPKGKSWFFGIGINRYLHFPDLNNAVRDVKDVLILLQHEYGIESERVITLFEEEATRNNIIDKLDELTSQVGPADKLIIYYSGHGHLNKHTNLAYWIPQDAQRNRASGYIPNSTVRDYIKSIPSLHTLLISDSCFSGTLFVRGTSRSTDAGEELEQRRSRWGIVSGRHDEEVYDGEPGTNSPFAASILNVLRRNRKDKLNVAKLADEVVEMTRANYTQLPEGNPLFGVGHDGGQYVFRLIGSEANIWERCITENSLAAHNAYLDKFPNGPHAGEALDRIKELEEENDWAGADRIDRIYAYQQFLRRFPQGKYAGEARKRITQLQEGDSRESEAFVQRDPHHHYTSLAEKKPHYLQGEESAWRKAQQIGTVAALQDFTRRYPSSQHLGEANRLIEQSQQAPKDNPLQYVKQYWPHGLGVLLLFVLALWGIPAMFGGGGMDATTSVLSDSTAQQADLLPTDTSGSGEPSAINPVQEETGRRAAPSPEVDNTAEQEQQAAQADDRGWRTAQRINTKAAYQQYLQQFPNGRHAAKANQAIQKIDDAAGSPKKGSATLGGQTYNTIQFTDSGLIWMAENLTYGSFTAGGGRCYDNESSNCSKYGRLYSWEAAKKACREIGWRLPTDREWRDLAKRFGGAGDDAADRGKAAYEALTQGGESGFSARLGGFRYASDRGFSELGDSGGYWSATDDGPTYVWGYNFRRGELRREIFDKRVAYSCRCVKD